MSLLSALLLAPLLAVAAPAQATPAAAPLASRTPKVTVYVPQGARGARDLSDMAANAVRVEVANMPPRSKVTVFFGAQASIITQPSDPTVSGLMPTLVGTWNGHVFACTSRVARCTKSVDVVYHDAGRYKVKSYVGSRLISWTPVTIGARTTPWQVPAGWVQPAGWMLLFPSDGATFRPCQVLTWRLDTAGQAADRARMIEDIRTGLALLTEQTSLQFVEAPALANPTILFSWADLRTIDPDFAGLAHVDQPSRTATTTDIRGTVKFSTTDEWTQDTWAGAAKVRREWDENGYHYWQEFPGRAWLVVHEVGHVLGLDHVADRAQVMNPTIYVSAFGGADLDALHTLYARSACTS